MPTTAPSPGGPISHGGEVWMLSVCPDLLIWWIIWSPNLHKCSILNISAGTTLEDRWQDNMGWHAWSSSTARAPTCPSSHWQHTLTACYTVWGSCSTLITKMIMMNKIIPLPRWNPWYYALQSSITISWSRFWMARSWTQLTFDITVLMLAPATAITRRTQIWLVSDVPSHKRVGLASDLVPTKQIPMWLCKGWCCRGVCPIAASDSLSIVPNNVGWTKPAAQNTRNHWHCQTWDMGIESIQSVSARAGNKQI